MMYLLIGTISIGCGPAAVPLPVPSASTQVTPAPAALDATPTTPAPLAPAENTLPIRLPDGMWTTASLVNVRADWSEEAPVVARFEFGTQVTVQTTEEDWAKVTASGTTGWLKRQFLTEHAVSINLDIDEDLELVLMWWTGEEGSEGAEPHVTVRDGTTMIPWEGVSKWRVDYLVEGSLTAIPAAVAGVPLVEVNLNTGGCAGGVSSLLGLAGGELYVAMEVGHWELSDGTVQFSPEHGTAKVTTTYLKDEDLDEVSGERPVDRVEVQSYRLVDGRFLPESVSAGTTIGMTTLE